MADVGLDGSQPYYLDTLLLLLVRKLLGEIGI
jgi:hypothetical protein